MMTTTGTNKANDKIKGPKLGKKTTILQLNDPFHSRPSTDSVMQKILNRMQLYEGKALVDLPKLSSPPCSIHKPIFEVSHEPQSVIVSDVIETNIHPDRTLQSSGDDDCSSHCTRRSGRLKTLISPQIISKTSPRLKISEFSRINEIPIKKSENRAVECFGTLGEDVVVSPSSGPHIRSIPEESLESISSQSDHQPSYFNIYNSPSSHHPFDLQLKKLANVDPYLSTGHYPPVEATAPAVEATAPVRSQKRRTVATQHDLVQSLGAFAYTDNSSMKPLFKDYGNSPNSNISLRCSAQVSPHMLNTQSDRRTEDRQDDDDINSLCSTLTTSIASLPSSPSHHSSPQLKTQSIQPHRDIACCVSNRERWQQQQQRSTGSVPNDSNSLRAQPVCYYPSSTSSDPPNLRAKSGKFVCSRSDLNFDYDLASTQLSGMSIAQLMAELRKAQSKAITAEARAAQAEDQLAKAEQRMVHLTTALEISNESLTRLQTIATRLSNAERALTDPVTARRVTMFQAVVRGSLSREKSRDQFRARAAEETGTLIAKLGTMQGECNFGWGKD